MKHKIDIFLPLVTKTLDNLRCHWSVKAKLVKEQRETTYWMLKTKSLPESPVTITITRCAPRRLDTTNLGSALKGVIDGCSDAMGVDDSQDDLMAFDLRQRKQSLVGVEVTIEGRK